MRVQSYKVWMMLSVVLACLGGLGRLRGQEAPPAEPPPIPKGVEVLARGPVHEAFAGPTGDPEPTKPIAKRPPKPLEEMPPDQKPDGDVIWVSGYWAYDDDRKDFLWVSGIWRTPPAGRQWIAGYWRDTDDGGAQWVPGFWAVATEKDEEPQQVTYLPQPPAPPEVAPPGAPPAADTFYVPGAYEWRADHYVWRAGYWARVQPGYLWVPGHYRWTPSGYIYIAGYWDLSVAKRGVLFAPVIVDTEVVGATYVYSPTYVVRDTIVFDSLFIRPCCCHYYFGDYYGPAYAGIGFESCFVYGRAHYDSLVVGACWEHREEPGWLSIQVNLFGDRCRGVAPCPPRTLVQQNTIVNNVTNVTNVTNNNVTNVTKNTTINNSTTNNVTNVAKNTTNINKTTVNNNQVLLPASQMAAAKGGAIKTVALSATARAQVKQQAQQVQQVAVAQRRQAEVPAPGGKITQPRVATLSVPKTTPSAAPGAQGVSRTSTSTGATAPGKPATGTVSKSPGATQGTTATNHTPAPGTHTPAPSSGQRPGSPQPGAGTPGSRPGTGSPGTTGTPGTHPPGQPVRPQPPATQPKPQPKPAPGNGKPEDKKHSSNGQ
jgi:hypothetical protein